MERRGSLHHHHLEAVGRLGTWGIELVAASDPALLASELGNLRGAIEALVLVDRLAQARRIGEVLQRILEPDVPEAWHELGMLIDPIR